MDGGEDHSGYFTDYMVMRPDRATMFDLFHLLYSGRVSENRAIDCPADRDALTEIGHRWLIVFSFLVQKFLLFIRRPVLWLGFMIGFWENLDVQQFFHNVLHGRLVLPDSTSASYRSFIGCLDRRMDLDSKIEPGDERYHAALTIMAAKLAYENEANIRSTITNHWKMEFLHYFDCWNAYENESCTRAFMFVDKLSRPELIVVAFGGTEPFNMVQWCADIDFSWYEIADVGKIHGGFMKALGLQPNKGWPEKIEQKGDDNKTFAYYAIREKLRDLLRANENARFIVTGHSLGGALAILFPSVLVIHKEEQMLKRLEGVYTFGQPRVGDEKFGEFVKHHLSRPYPMFFRYVYCNDMVARLPHDDRTLLFKHFGSCLYYNSIYKGKVMREEPNRNYFSLLSVGLKYANAVWELGRSFIIGYLAGSEYREGWALRLLRVLGLLVPGLPAHSPQDYVNSTRLGTPLVPDDGL